MGETDQTSVSTIPKCQQNSQIYDGNVSLNSKYE